MMRLPVVSAAALAVAMVGACSKPAADAKATTETAAADTGAAASDATGGATAPGGAVSPPASNAAVDTNATADTPPEAASNSFTEGEAKGHIENAGYTDVTALSKTPDGFWTAKARKDGKAVDVTLDFKGAVTAK